MTLSDRWNLESVFVGGSRSVEFRDFVLSIEQDVAQLGDRAQALSIDSPDAEIVVLLVDTQQVESHLAEAVSFAECLRAEDAGDAQAGQWMARIDEVAASLKSIEAILSAYTACLPNERWEIGSGIYRGVRWTQQLRD